MRDYVTEHLAKWPISYPETIVRPPIVCADGYAYSVQASQFHYCSPRDDSGPWSAVEVWGINPKGQHTTRDPRGWVPLARINRTIHRHGGPA